jgi:hypothetical protein
VGIEARLRSRVAVGRPATACADSGRSEVSGTQRKVSSRYGIAQRVHGLEMSRQIEFRLRVICRNPQSLLGNPQAPVLSRTGAFIMRPFKL